MPGLLLSVVILQTVIVYKIICGKGHNLNELVNRCIRLALQSSDYDLLDDSNQWNLYPGPLGLYARHNDFFGLTDDEEQTAIMYFYKNYVRNAMADVDHRPDGDKVKQLISQLHPDKFYTFYINVTENHYQYIADHFPQQNIFTSKLSLQNSNQRHHHLMMEYSIGAAESRDYSEIPTLKELCQRLLKVDYREQEVELPDNFVTIDTNLLLQNDFSELFDKLNLEDPHIVEYKTNVLTKAIEQYKLYNIPTHPDLVEINRMSWQQVITTANT